MKNLPKFTFKKSILVILPFFVFYILLLLVSANTHAQSSIPLIVAPARQTVNIDPGQTETISIRFMNQADAPLGGNIKVVDFIVDDNTGSPLLLEGGDMNNKYSAASWVKLPSEKAVIPAGEIHRIQAKLSAPIDAAAGGRYVAIYFEPTGTLPSGFPVDFNYEGSQAIGSKIVGLVYIRVSGPITEGAIVKRFESPKFIEYGPVSILAEIQNRGDYHITPKGNITLTNWSGKTMAEYTLHEKNIFPEKSRTYDVQLGNKFMFGKYTLNLLAIYGDNNQTLKASVSFWAFPWRLALIIILTITILIMGSVMIYKNLKGRQIKLETKLEEEIDEIESLKNRYKDKIPQK